MFERVYTELRSLAAAKLSRERSDHTLDATALVHEAYLRLGSPDKEWENKRHFFGAAAEAMRRILVDHARRKQAAKRGGDLDRTQLHESRIAAPDGTSDELLAVHEALDRLAQRAPEAAEVVKLRYFTGLTMAEIAEALAIPKRSAEEHWTFARAWLHKQIEEEK